MAVLDVDQANALVSLGQVLASVPIVSPERIKSGGALA
jgi:hypothetical protein